MARMLYLTTLNRGSEPKWLDLTLFRSRVGERGGARLGFEGDNGPYLVPRRLDDGIQNPVYA